MKIKIKQFGFTLVEVLIVVALIVVLVSMVLVATNKNRVDKEKQLTTATIELLDTALQEYYDYTNDFPEPNLPQFQSFDEQHNMSLCFQLNSRQSSKSVIEKIADSQKTIIDEYLVIVDAWGTVFNYLYDEDYNTFPVIISAGPDRKFFMTADNIDNRK